VKHLLLSALRTDRLPHAYLFYGPHGVGKDAMGLELARILNCETRGENACGICPPCVAIAGMQHPDVRLVVPLPRGKDEQSDDPPLAKLSSDQVGSVQAEYRRKGEDPYYQVEIPGATAIKITSIREVRREAAMTVSGGKKRVFLVSPAEEMTDQAANALLKTLEEPSGGCLLILTTENREALLPTIVSRCQQVRFDLLTENEIAEALVRRDGVEEERAGLLSRLASGSYARARDLLGEDVAEERTRVVEFIRHALAGNVEHVAAEAERLQEAKDRELVRRFLLGIHLWYRDALVLAHGGAVINGDHRAELERFVMRNPGADLQLALREAEHALSLLDRNTYIKLIIPALAIRLRATMPGKRQ
jgi:DNA polymerase-3 subunit delta'